MSHVLSRLLRFQWQTTSKRTLSLVMLSTSRHKSLLNAEHKCYSFHVTTKRTHDLHALTMFREWHRIYYCYICLPEQQESHLIQLNHKFYSAAWMQITVIISQWLTVWLRKRMGLGLSSNDRLEQNKNLKPPSAMAGKTWYKNKNNATRITG